jgi:hypothetical protein
MGALQLFSDSLQLRKMLACSTTRPLLISSTVRAPTALTAGMEAAETERMDAIVTMEQLRVRHANNSLYPLHHRVTLQDEHHAAAGSVRAVTLERDSLAAQVAALSAARAAADRAAQQAMEQSVQARNTLGERVWA